MTATTTICAACKAIDTTPTQAHLCGCQCHGEREMKRHDYNGWLVKEQDGTVWYVSDLNAYEVERTLWNRI